MKIHNYIFLGESGCGKTELSLNTALKLREHGVEKVTFIDMDQTKCMFRARDHFDFLKKNDIALLETVEAADSPIVPQGVTTALSNPEMTCVLDVGGNAIGARMIGQYAEYFTAENTEFYYIINSYRAFSGDSEHIAGILGSILISASVDPQQIKFISNPCFGSQTEAQDVLEGHARLVKDLQKMNCSIYALTVDERLYAEVHEKVDCPTYPIRRFVEYVG